MPILLSIESVSFGLRPFHFFNSWSDHPELHSIVKDGWEGNGVSTPSFWDPMIVVRGVVKRWQDDHFSDNERHIFECEATLKELMFGQEPFSDEDLAAF